ncbi:MAG TPA: hypothetical protein VK638_19490 [Edaphobacter sp.]|nr:hypothetical protein [Edaphobacter sp.]
MPTDDMNEAAIPICNEACYEELASEEEFYLEETEEELRADLIALVPDSSGLNA